MKLSALDQSADTVYPVILAVSPQKQRLRGRTRADELSRRARSAVQLSARFSGLKLTNIEKSNTGKPLPDGGTFWSLSHKLEYVAGVVSQDVTGIDIEKIRECSTALCRKIADEMEWRLAGSIANRRNRSHVFFRYWTSKEAVLKAEGVGLQGLSKCRIERVIDANRLIVAYMGREWPVEHFFFDGHIVSVVMNTNTVEWLLFDHHNAR